MKNSGIRRPFKEVEEISSDQWGKVKDSFVFIRTGKIAPVRAIENEWEGFQQVMAQFSMPLTKHGYELFCEKSGYYLYVRNIYSDFSKGFAVRATDGKVFSWELLE